MDFAGLFKKHTAMKYILSIIMSTLLFASCKKEPNTNIITPTVNTIVDEGNSFITLNIPNGFAYPEIPDDNLFTQNRIDLGKRLFFDPLLSKDNSISCASCHFPDVFFSDTVQFSVGVEARLGERNSPSLVNVAYQPSLFWDGGSPTLEQQVLGPIDNHLEFDFDIYKILDRLRLHPEYPQQFLDAYDREISVFTLTRAIANYERTLIGGTSRYDASLQSPDSNILTASEKNGKTLFFSEKAECFHCHQGALFTDFSFRNNGLYTVYADSGRARITQWPGDVGKFKVPSLRNIAKTAPYMHDGSIATLEEVIEHYAKGGNTHPVKSPIIGRLRLTAQEKTDLINFLKTLTDE